MPMDTLTVGVIPVSNAPPDAVTDLLASANPSIEGQISLVWTAPQGNLGGYPIPNVTVQSYTVRYATFSVDSLSGDTTAWWNHPGVTSVDLSPPDYVPLAPGGFESYTFTGLTPGQVYYFAVKSTSPNNVVSEIDTEASTPTQQAHAIATIFASGTSPAKPNGLTSSLAGSQFTFSWHAVTRDQLGQPLTPAQYRVDRYLTLDSTAPLTSTTLAGGTLSFSETVPSQPLRYYRVVSIGANTQESLPSDFVDSSPAGNRYALAPDDTTTRVVVHGQIAKELLSENNPYGEDLELRLARRSQDEVDTTLRSYRIGAFIARTGSEVEGFTFSKPLLSVQLGYGAVLGSPGLNSSQMVTIQNVGKAAAGSIAQIVSVYWFTGRNFIRISDPVLTSNQALSVNVRALGVYQIRAARLSNSFQLTQGSPYPRVITPNGAENRRVFFFFDNPTDSAVTGAIYDIRGAKVRDLQVDGLSPTTTSIVWDGRDMNGAVVPSGVYLYKLSAGDQQATGTVVVAR